MKESKLQKFIIFVVQVIAFFMLCYLLLMSIFGTSLIGKAEDVTKRYYLPDRWWQHVIIWLIALVSIALIVRVTKETLHIHRFILYGIYLAAGLFFIFGAREYPISDPYKVYEIAKSILNGDVSSYVNKDGYMYRYPFQNGIVLFNIILIKIFGNNAFLAFQVINLLFQIVFLEYLGRITDLMWDDRKVTTLTRLVVVLFPCYFFNITYNYGTIISLSLIVVSIYYELSYFRTSLKRHALLSALLAAIACVFKSNSRIIVVAMAIVLLLELAKSRKNLVIGITFLLLLISFRPIAALAVDKCVEKITGVETPSGMPELNWIAMGLTDPGNYNGTSVNIFAEAGYDSEKSKEMSLEFIKKRLAKLKSDRSEALKWLGRKQSMNWNDPTFETLGLNDNREYAHFSTFFDGLFSGKLSKVIITYLNYFQSLILLGALLFVLLADPKGNKTLILLIASIGGFLFHIFWEGSSHYLLPYFIIMIPYSVHGFNTAITDFLNNRVKKVRVAIMATVILLVLLLRNGRLLEYTIFIQDDIETVGEYYEKAD